MVWLILFAVFCVFIYILTIKPLSYWKNMKIPYQNPWPIVGNFGSVVFKRKPLIELVEDFYTAFPNDRYNGIHQFTTPVLIVRDVDLIKQITIKDFDHFTDHRSFITEDMDPLVGGSLFFLTGQRWRDMRSTLSPTFTSSKMKTMFVLLSECAEQFTNYIEKQYQNEFHTATVEMKEIFTRFTNDAIASVAFGVKVDSLEDKNNEFYAMGKNVTNFSILKFLLISMSPTLARLVNLKFFTPAVSGFFRRIIKDTIEQREREKLIRPDMIHLLMEARKGRLRHEQIETKDEGFATVLESNVGKSEMYTKLELSDDNITAQALVFFFAGFEMISALMSFTAYELAVHPEVQKKLQDEIDDTLKKCNGKITYEQLLKMKYLDMVVSETLRMWPPAFQTDRVCVKDYTIKPERLNERPFTIKKGQLIIIPVYGIHRDPKFFPNPDKFDPERFSEENKHNIDSSTYLPFGAGPRSCIASRLALLENKTLFFYLLAKFNIEVVEKTPIPLRLAPGELGMIPREGGFWLGPKLRNEHYPNIK